MSRGGWCSRSCCSRTCARSGTPARTTSVRSCRTSHTPTRRRRRSPPPRRSPTPRSARRSRSSGWRTSAWTALWATARNTRPTSRTPTSDASALTELELHGPGAAAGRRCTAKRPNSGQPAAPGGRSRSALLAGAALFVASVGVRHRTSVWKGVESAWARPQRPISAGSDRGRVHRCNGARASAGAGMRGEQVDGRRDRPRSAASARLLGRGCWAGASLSQRVPLGCGRDDLLMHRREQLGELAGAGVRVGSAHRRVHRRGDRTLQGGVQGVRRSGH